LFQSNCEYIREENHLGEIHGEIEEKKNSYPVKKVLSPIRPEEWKKKKTDQKERS